MDWGAAVSAVPLGADGGGAKHTGAVSLRRWATIEFWKFLFASAHFSLWGQRWLGMTLWPLPTSVPLVAGRSILAERDTYKGYNLGLEVPHCQCRFQALGEMLAWGDTVASVPLGDYGGQ